MMGKPVSASTRITVASIRDRRPAGSGGHSDGSVSFLQNSYIVSIEERTVNTGRV